MLQKFINAFLWGSKRKANMLYIMALFLQYFHSKKNYILLLLLFLNQQHTRQQRVSHEATEHREADRMMVDFSDRVTGKMENGLDRVVKLVPVKKKKRSQ